jgi:two-component system, cell cycle sensor histidine kinase and response regulator CckA
MNILYIEGSPVDADLLKREFLRVAPQVKVEWVMTHDEALAKLTPSAPSHPPYDVVLCDALPPDESAVSLIPLLQERNLPIAVVVLTTIGSEERAVAALRAGADDYVVKRDDYLTRLPAILEAAVERYRAKVARQQAGVSASEAILKSEQWLRATLAACPIGVGLARNGVIEWVNESLCRMSGYVLEELQGKDPRLLYETDEEYKRARADLHRNGQVETRLVAKNGSVRDALVQISAQDGDSFIYTVSDITAQKQAEHALRITQFSVDKAFDGFIWLGEGGKILYANEAMCEATGYTRDELLSMSIMDIDPALSVERWNKLWTSRRETLLVESRCRTRDGRIYPVEISANRLQYEGNSYVCATIRNIAERKQAEEALKRSEATLRSVFTASPVATALVTPHNRAISWINDRMIAMLGYVFEDLRAQGPRALYRTDEEFARVGEILYSPVRRGEVGETDTQWVRKDGSIMDIILRASAVNPKDISEGVVITAVDVTDRRRVERNLLESEERYRTLIEHSNDAITIVGKGIHIYVNQKFLEMFGYDEPEEVVGKPPSILTHPDDRQELKQYGIRREQGAQVPTRYERRGVRKDGTVIFFEVSVASTIYRGETVTLAILRDITERKRAEEAVQESEVKYRNVIENSLVGFYIVQDNLFRFVSKRWCEISGYTREEAVDKFGPLDSVIPEDRKLVEENLRKRLTGEADHLEYEFRIIRKDGKTIAVKVLGSGIVYNGRAAATGTIIDITKERTLEAQLRQAQKMEAIGTLAGGIAHDFNNLLTVLSGYGTLLQNGIDKTNPLRMYVDQIVSASMKAANLTQGLLAFSRQQPITLTPTDLNSLVKGTEKLLKRLLTEDITLQTVLTPDNITVLADGTQIDQILFNLATNARDAMPKGGTLTIETSLVNWDSESVRIQGFGKEGRYVLLSVSDTGRGMDEATKEKIFDPFFTTKEVGKGTGLGLSTVYGIVKQHRGYVAVYSEKGKGTSFHIYLPARAARQQEEPSAERIKGGSERILLAEDDQPVRTLIRDILTAYGYTVIEAEDGADAIEKFNADRDIEMVILDSVMPKKNGREVCDAISKQKPGIKVLFTSGYTRDVILDKGIEDNQVDFISKPLSPPTLLRKVRDLLDK